MKANKGKHGEHRETFINKLMIVSGTKQFFNYLVSSFSIISLVAWLIITGTFGACILLGGLLFIINIIIALAITVYGVNKVWKDTFE